MNTCMICLEDNGYVRKLCHAWVHLSCQRKWSSFCIICKKNTGIRTKKKYVFVPEAPELNQQELNLQIQLMNEIERRNALQQFIDEVAQREMEQFINEVEETIPEQQTSSEETQPTHHDIVFGLRRRNRSAPSS